MAVVVEIRNVPEDLHRRLKERAALDGMSVSEFLLREIERALARPTREELVQRLRSHGGADLAGSVVEAVAAERKGR